MPANAAQRRNPFPRMKVMWSYIGPKKAEALVKRSTHNRRLAPALVARYARDILRGSWGLAESAIIVDTKGNVINGQHRLNAVVQANQGAWFVLIENVPRNAIIDMDQGKKRALPEALTLSGRFNKKIDTNVSAWAKFIMLYGTGGNTKRFKAAPTHHEVADFIAQYYEALTRVRALVKKAVRGVTISPVLAVPVQAWIAGKSKTRLAQFVETLVTGESQGKADAAAIKLRNMLITSETNVGGTGRVEIYKKTRRALVYYLKGLPVPQLSNLEEDPWPVDIHGDATA